MRKIILSILVLVNLSVFNKNLEASQTNSTLTHSVTSCNDLDAIGSGYYKDEIWGLGDDYNIVYDLDCSGQDYTPVGDNGSENPDFFYGNIDGNNREITNLEIEGNNDVGLVAINAGTIKKINLLATDITGTNSVGAIAGINYGIITNCFVSGTINDSNATENRYFGGITGQNIGKVSYSGANIFFNGNNSRTVGGIAGLNDANAVIKNSFSNGEIDGGMREIGGIVGSNYGIIEDTYTAMTINLSDNSLSEFNALAIGGLVGYSPYGTINHSLALGKINSNSQVGDTINIGGFVGDANVDTEISNSYSTTILEGVYTGNSVGTFYGSNDGTLINSYNYNSQSVDENVAINGKYADFQEVKVDDFYLDTLGLDLSLIHI